MFLEKCCDGTSIQDIIDGLGGMNKGGIYYHFKSKFDILETLISQAGDTTTFAKWQGSNCLEKLRNSLKDSLNAHQKQSLGYSATVTLRSPRIWGEQYLQVFDDYALEIAKIVKEGIQDGSIQMEFPEEVAELILVAMNLWVGFQISVLSES